MTLQRVDLSFFKMSKISKHNGTVHVVDSYERQERHSILSVSTFLFIVNPPLRFYDTLEQSRARIKNSTKALRATLGRKTAGQLS